MKQIKIKVGLFMGTFDPPHEGHIQASLDLVERGVFDTVWLVPTPQNPGKHWEATPLGIRENMLYARLKDECGLMPFTTELPEDIEKLRDPDGKFYSYKQLDYVKERIDSYYNNDVGKVIDREFVCDYFIIHGQDVRVDKWKKGDEILKKFRTYELDRNINPISSTMIREMIGNMDLKVIEYIDPSILPAIRDYELYGYKKEKRS